METPLQSLTTYRDLADRYDQLGQVSMRDRFLMLAADAALAAGQGSEAERLRDRLLQGSRHHMLRPYRSFAEAVQAPDVQTYLRDLRANYPLDTANQLLESLRPGAGPPVEQTQPLNWAVSRPASPVIPPTAPLMDLYGSPGQERLARTPGKLPVELDPPVPVAAPATARPLAQPLPGRTVVPRAPDPQASVAPPVHVPKVEPPVPTSRYPLAPAAPIYPPAVSPAPPEGHAGATGEGGSWLAVLLVAVVAATGVGLVLYTLARPFLPEGLLP